MKILDIEAFEILDSVGQPALSCKLSLENGLVVHSSIARPLQSARFESKRAQGQTSSVQLINDVIRPHLIGKELDAVRLDALLLDLEGTSDKSKMGSDTLLVVSQAIYKACAKNEDMPLYDFIAVVFGAETVTLPIPMLSIFNGGINADNNLLFQDYFLIPFGAKSEHNALDLSSAFFLEMGRKLKELKKSNLAGLAGGYAPKFKSVSEPLDLISDIIKQFPEDVFAVGVNAASNNFYDIKSNNYSLGRKKLNSKEVIKYYKSLVEKYNLYCLEDGLSDYDWEGWIHLMLALEDKTQLIANELLASKANLIVKAIEYDAVNAVSINPSQVGTVTETLQAIQICQEYGLAVIISDREPTTNDTFITDLAVGCSANYVQFGGLLGGEHVVKYNRLLEIEDFLLDNPE